MFRILKLARQDAFSPFAAFFSPQNWMISIKHDRNVVARKSPGRVVASVFSLWLFLCFSFDRVF